MPTTKPVCRGEVTFTGSALCSQELVMLFPIGTGPPHGLEVNTGRPL